MIAAPILLMLLALILYARRERTVRVQEKVRTDGLGRSRDFPGALVGFFGSRLGTDRADWAAAMRAELDRIPDGVARWRFALGCVRVSLAPPLLEERSALPQQTLIATAAVSVIGLGLWVRQLSASDSMGGRGPLYNAVAVGLLIFLLAVQAGTASRRARAVDQRARTARTWGLLGGVILGAGLLVTQIPSLGGTGAAAGAIGLFVGFACLIVVGAGAARAAHDRRVGALAASWTGAVGGFIFAFGLLLMTVLTTRWFTTDQSTIHAYQDSLSSHFGSYHNHYRTITGYVMGENLDTALLGGFLWLPALAAIVGRIGARLGSA